MTCADTLARAGGRMPVAKRAVSGHPLGIVDESLVHGPEVLADELKVVLRFGLQPSRLAKLDILLNLAPIASEVRDDAPAIDRALVLERLLKQAIAGLGIETREATELLFGTAPTTRGLLLKTRRRRAAGSLGMTLEGFRRHREPQLLQQVAEELYRLEIEAAEKSVAGAADASTSSPPTWESSQALARQLLHEGIRRLITSRDDYPGTLRTFLSQAQRSISMVSVSLQVTHQENDHIELFRERLLAVPEFRVIVSLLEPHGAAMALAAEALKLEPQALCSEVQHMLRHLVALKNSLPVSAADRLQVLVHESLPMGSAILLDAEPTYGTIQVETKLHRAPRAHSFGFLVAGPSPFYSRNYRAWMEIIEESRAVTEADLEWRQ